MSQHQSITVAGQTFASIAAAIKHFNVTRSTTYKRIANNESLEAVFNVQEKDDSQAKFEPHKITCHGENFESISQFASHHGLNANKVRGRLFRGQTPEEILDKLSPEKPASKKSLRVKGKTYGCTEKLAEDFNIPHSLVEARLNAGWTASQAVEVSKSPNTQPDAVISLTIGKKTYPNISAIAKDKKVDEAALIALMFVGVTPGAAVKKLKQDKKDHVIYNGHAYRSERELVAAHDTPMSTYYKRRSKGMSIAEALDGRSNSKRVEKQAIETTETPKSSSRDKRKKIKFRGETYPSIRAFANAFGIEYRKVHYRLKNGWTYAQAVEKTIAPKEKKDTPELLNIKDMLPLNVEGKKFESAVELAKHYGLNAPRVTGRLRNGWTPEEAVEITPRGESTKPNKKAEQLDLFEKQGDSKPGGLNYKGKKYKNLFSLCKELNLNYNRVSARVRNKWTLEAAINTPAGKRGRPMKTSNKSRGQSQRTSKRLRSAISNTDKKEPFDLSSTVKLGKKKFNTVSEFASYHKLDENVTLNRLNMNWSPESIIGDAPLPHWD